eukprot:scaffold109673_cov21-Phaeocystis_antarctica.AAC.1
MHASLAGRMGLAHSTSVRAIHWLSDASAEQRRLHCGCFGLSSSSCLGSSAATCSPPSVEDCASRAAGGLVALE